MLCIAGQEERYGNYFKAGPGHGCTIGYPLVLSIVERLGRPPCLQICCRTFFVVHKEDVKTSVEWMLLAETLWPYFWGTECLETTLPYLVPFDYLSVEYRFLVLVWRPICPPSPCRLVLAFQTTHPYPPICFCCFHSQENAGSRCVAPRSLGPRAVPSRKTSSDFIVARSTMARWPQSLLHVARLLLIKCWRL